MKKEKAIIKTTEAAPISSQPEDLPKAIKGKAFSNITLNLKMKLITVEMGKEGSTTQSRFDYVMGARKALQEAGLSGYRMYQVYGQTKYFSTI
jgi:hypothetical protein